MLLICSLFLCSFHLYSVVYIFCNLVIVSLLGKVSLEKDYYFFNLKGLLKGGYLHSKLLDLIHFWSLKRHSGTAVFSTSWWFQLSALHADGWVQMKNVSFSYQVRPTFKQLS